MKKLLRNVWKAIKAVFSGIMLGIIFLNGGVSSFQKMVRLGDGEDQIDASTK